jgi:hypothetical protein
MTRPFSALSLSACLSDFTLGVSYAQRGRQVVCFSVSITKLELTS